MSLEPLHDLPSVLRFAEQIQQRRRRIELLSIRFSDERIVAALKDGLLVADMGKFSEEIGLAQKTVYRTLSTLTRQGRIVKKARGQYQLLLQQIK